MTYHEQTALYKSLGESIPDMARAVRLLSNRQDIPSDLKDALVAIAQNTFILMVLMTSEEG